MEILTATALLTLISLFLAGMASQSARVWNQGEGQTDRRQKARAALDYIGRELQQALLSADAANGPLQFVVDPPAVASFPFRDTLFWQAPIATDSGRGDLAEIGYFVRWNGTKAALCRFFVNPSDTVNYHLYDTAPAPWVTDALLDAVAPADKASHYQGLFLANVIGLWVDARRSDGTAWGGDSRSEGGLPASVEISLVSLDAATAARLSASDASAIRGLYGSTATAAAFMAALPSPTRAGASVASVRVGLDNAR